MAWYNNLGDLGGDLKSIATGHNPSNNPPMVGNMPAQGSPLTNSQTPGLPFASTPPGPSSPFAGAPPGFNQQAFEQQLMTSPDLAGVWQTIQQKGGDIWGVLTKFFPKNTDGNIDWGKVGGDVLGFVKSIAPTIVEGLSAVNQYQRQQQSDKYAQQGLDLAQKTYAENAPLRDAGRSGLLSAGAYKPDLTNLKSVAAQGGTGLPFASAGASPSAAPKPNSQTLPIASGPPIPTPTPSGGGSRMPLPNQQSQFGSQFQGPASQIPQPQPGAPTGMVPGIGAGGVLTPKPTLPIAAGPPNPLLNRKPPLTLPFASGQ